jgi:hypothetical protein
MNIAIVIIAIIAISLAIWYARNRKNPPPSGGSTGEKNGTGTASAN